MRYKGFGILEGMLALALFALVTTGMILFTANNTTQKNAKTLSTQTEAFAAAFAKYMKSESVYPVILLQAQTGPVTLSPQLVGSAWPVDLAQINMYHQTPCVTIVMNHNTGGLEAVMYYVGGVNQKSTQAVNLVRSAAINLGGKGGILLNGAVQGNSGWGISSSSAFLGGAGQCGGTLANNSVAVNLGLMPEWNQDLQPSDSILRGEDLTPGQQSLPGRFRNANTSKSNLYFEPGYGIILDNSVPESPTKLAVLYNGQGSGAPTLGLGESVSSKLLSDTFQPNIFFKAGNFCKPEEDGKTVADSGESDATNQVLTRNILVCTQNDLLCGAGNYCYITSQPNSITFQNINRGIQNVSGQFICPASVPFAMSVKTGILGGGQIYVMVNTGGTTSPDTITAVLKKGSEFTTRLNCPVSGCNPGIRTDYRSGIIDGQGELMSIDLATVNGSPVGLSVGNGTGTDYQVIQGSIGNYTTPIGYRVNGASSSSCAQVCSNLSDVLGNSWQLLGTQRKSRVRRGVDIYNQSLGCACERTDFSGANPDNYNGIAVVIGYGQSIIVSATCSNMPLFNTN